MTAPDVTPSDVSVPAVVALGPAASGAEASPLSATASGETAPGETASGVVSGRPLTWLRIEGLAVAGAALVVFAATGQPWWLVPALFLVPDLSWLGYLAGPKVGAWIYNLAHTAPLPLTLLAAGAGWHITALTVAGAVGLFHLGIDRLLKYGVKYDHSFGLTHLGAHGPTDRPSSAGKPTPAGRPS